jgi:hypothetical protein
METHEFALNAPEPFAPLSGLSSREVFESLGRLKSHGLVDGEAGPPLPSSYWMKLRVTAQGWVVLGEWPDLDRVATAASLQGLLRALADDAPGEDRDALTRAAGAVGRTADEVVRATAADIARTLGREVTEE